MALTEEELNDIRTDKRKEEMDRIRDEEMHRHMARQVRREVHMDEKRMGDSPKISIPQTSWLEKIKGKFVKTPEQMEHERELERTYQQRKHEASLRAEVLRAEADVRRKYARKINKGGGIMSRLGGGRPGKKYADSLKKNLLAMGNIGISTASLDRDTAEMSGVGRSLGFSMARATKQERRANKRGKRRYNTKFYDDAVYDLI